MQTKRYASLDQMRGLALFGILLINVPAFQSLTDDSPYVSTLLETTTLDLWITVLIEKKFFSIFSFLFGVGFYLFTTRAAQKGERPLRLFCRRLFFLFVFGVFHVLLFPGSILAIYAVIGLGLLPLERLSARATGVWLAVLLASVVGTMTYNVLVLPTKPFMGDAFLIYLMFVTGAYVGKKGWLEPTEAMQTFWKRLFLFLLPIIVVGGIVTFSTFENEVLASWIVALSSIPTAYGYIAGLFLLFNNERISHFFAPVGAVGKMAFTNYVLQHVLGVIFIALFSFPIVTSKEAVWLACLIYGIELLWSTWYMKRHAMGPLELVWRKWTYRTKKRPGSI